MKIARAELCTAMGVSADTFFDPADSLESGLETTETLEEWLDIDQVFPSNMDVNVILDYLYYIRIL